MRVVRICPENNKDHKKTFNGATTVPLRFYIMRLQMIGP